MKYTFEIEDHDHYSLGWSGGTFIDVEAQDEETAEREVRGFLNIRSVRAHFGECIRVKKHHELPKEVKKYWGSVERLYSI